MPFSISQKTLERLEWREILAQLAERAQTPRGRERLVASGAGGVPGTALFEASGAAVRARLEATAEAAAVLETGDRPPLGALAELTQVLGRARRGGALAARELVAVADALAALAETGRFLGRHAALAPGLSARADGVVPHALLRGEIERCIGPQAELRDEASPTLAEARREAQRLAAEIQGRIEGMLRDPEVRAQLSDAWFTVRGDRFVLPVRADSRGAVRGIVHDASRSGTTLFVEPEGLVELNNRHKRAELGVEQETLRVLRELSRGVADAADDIEHGLDTLAELDLAFAAGQLAHDWRAVRPEVREEGILSLPQLRHPILGAEAVPNDLRLGREFRVLVLSGPNAGGKTVAMKSLALAVLLTRAGLFVPAQAPARVDLFDAVLADIGDEQDIREHLSSFSAHMANLAHIAARADARSLVVLDEIGVGTDPGEGAAIAQAVLEALADSGACVVTTTHHHLLKEMAEVDDRFANASVDFDPETLAPTYRLRMGHPGSSSAAAVAARMGMPRAVLERAEGLLGREDRRLDRMLAELAASRATLEHETLEAQRMRREGEAARGEYAAKLERFQSRRDELYQTLRADLDRAFRAAHQEIAGVVRELQRGDADAREAARARERLLELEERARSDHPEPASAPGRPVDWNRARPGDPVVVREAGPAVLVALPDRRGRVAVRLGSARILVPMERVGAGEAAAPPRPRSPRPALPPVVAGGTSRCDLRGMRTDEAIEELAQALDRAAAAGASQVIVIHGVGTGALRRAVREHLRDSPYVEHFVSGAAEAGGDGVTEAVLGT